MASNQPFNASIIDFQATKDASHSLQANVFKVNGKDGAAVVAQGAAESFSSPIISNERVPTVLCRHDLSKVHGEDGMVMEAQGLAESISPSILNANITNVHGRAREDDLIHDMYSTQSWADRAEEGEFIPQVVLDLEAEFGGFSKDIMDSFHSDSSSPSLRGRRNLNNGSPGGRRGSSAWVARGIQTNNHLIRPAFCCKEGLSLQDQNRKFPLGNRETHGGNGRPTLGQKKGEIRGSIPLVRRAQYGTKGLTKKGANNQYPLGTSGTFERARVPSEDNQKADGTAISSSTLSGHRREAIGDQLVGNESNQGNEVQAVQDVRGGNTLGVKRVQLVGNVSNQGNEEQAVQGGVSAQKEAFSEIICSSKGLPIHANNGEHPLGNSCIHRREGGPTIGMRNGEMLKVLLVQPLFVRRYGLHF
ncbi:hypothetical protein F0562_001714 [Nyssa sinensis]|uniref:Uncharacterized protein n=1 Tax=Nyssa sinensis TaxID=561372 RepID=A0A5J5C7S1_9ASTE|nr:hypothetical protein F0562_001714 [Nyssa sinensis]